MRLYSLGELDWKDTQLIYHAMAHLGHEGVVICRPKSPYYCVGFHQDVSQELDLDLLKELKEPCFRRETGGGTVRLDAGQVFYQIVIRRDNPECPPNPERFYERFLQPAIDALMTLGLGAIVAEPNDLLVNNKKISGNGGGDVGECKVLVGDLLVDFDASKMCRGLRCPTQKFRQACQQSMQSHMTSVSQQLPGTTVAEVERAMRASYLKVCGEGESMSIPQDVLLKSKELKHKMLSDDWLAFPGPVRPWRKVKVREGVHVGALAIEHDERTCGYLQIGYQEGSLDVAITSSIAAGDDSIDPTCLEVLTKGLDQEGPLMKDLKRLLQEMDVPKDQMDQAVLDISKSLSLL